MARLKDKISPIYDKVLNRSLLDLEFPAENYIQCTNCYLSANKKDARTNTKCCDYHPILPNFIVGGILSDTRPAMAEGKARIAGKIVNRIGLTPYGILPSYRYAKLFTKTRRRKGIPLKSEHEDLLCPYFDKGLCTIWDYRSELCTTFHCNSVAAKEGDKFWKLFLQYITKTEWRLSLHLLKELDYPVDKIITERLDPVKLKLDDEKEQIDEKKYDELWGDFKGQEEQFFISCFTEMQKLDPEKFLNMRGVKLDILEQQLNVQSEIMSQNVEPDYLKIELEESGLKKNLDGTFNIGKIRFSAEVLELIKSFDGKTKTFDIIWGGMKEGKPISHIIKPLMEAGVLVLNK